MYAASTARFGLLHTARLVAENELRKTESHSPAQVVRVEGERDRVLQERWPRRAEVGFYGTQQLVRSDVAGWGVIRKWWYSRCLRNWLLDLDVERRILYFFQECLKWFGFFCFKSKNWNLQLNGSSFSFRGKPVCGRLSCTGGSTRCGSALRWRRTQTSGAAKFKQWLTLNRRSSPKPSFWWIKSK